VNSANRRRSGSGLEDMPVLGTGSNSGRDTGGEGAKPMPVRRVARRAAQSGLCWTGDRLARRARPLRRRRGDTVPRPGAGPAPWRERRRLDSTARSRVAARRRKRHSRCGRRAPEPARPSAQERTRAWKRARKSRVTGPAFPLPMSRPSNCRIATISVAVPVRNASSAV
jgi:hypothetical protein